MFNKKLLSTSILTFVALGMVGCQGEKKVDSKIEDQQKVMELANKPKPQILDKLIAFLERQAIGSGFEKTPLEYPTTESFFKDTNHLVSEEYLGLKSQMCSKNLECQFFLDVGYASKVGLIDELQMYPDIHHKYQSFDNIDAKYLTERLQYALGVQPYSGKPYELLKSNRCDAQCKALTHEGMRIVWTLAEHIGQNTAENVSFKTEVALGRIVVVDKSEKKFADLAPVEPIQYDYVEPPVIVNKPQPPVAHTYQEKILQQSRTVKGQEIDEPLELVPDAVGIVENKHVSEAATNATTYSELIGDNSNLNPKTDHAVEYYSEPTPHINIQRRKEKTSENMDEYILIH